MLRPILQDEHILTFSQVTNDDGPPSEHSSPYVLPFVEHLQKAGHTVSVILPDNQRSWIGKAHLVGKDVNINVVRQKGKC